MAAGKKRKASAISKKKKKKRGGAPEAVAMKKKKKSASSSSSLSLFETLWSQKKFDILGKKQKGQGRRLGLSRSRAIDKRKNTLLQEYNQRGKANMFLDHRFGEKDKTLAEEDKAILRFQRERQVQLQKKSRYLLPDEDDDEVLTHGGSALSTLDDFKDDMSFEDTDEEQNMDGEFVRKLHFGGGATVASNENDGGQERQKSKKEIMEEIIAKSKFYKAQKAKEKEEDAELKDLLDKEYTTLIQSEAFTSLAQPKKGSAFELSLARASTAEGVSLTQAATANQALSEQEKPDDFDKLVKEMGTEMRAHASDRLKTTEEIAQEEKTRLEELERKRKKRMLGEADSDDSEEEKNDKVDKEGRKKKRRSEVSGDDLGDNLFWEARDQERGWVDEILARSEYGNVNDEVEGSVNDDENGEMESDSEGNDGSDSGYGMVEDQDTDSTDEDWDETDEESTLPVNDSAAARKNLDMETRKYSKHTEKLRIQQLKFSTKNATESLPFVIEAPKTLNELQLLVDSRPVGELLIAIQRIRTCNAISLAAENRMKMQVFYGVLLQYFATLSGETPLAMGRINALVKPLIEMSSETPYFAAVCARQWISRIHHQLSEKVRNSDEASSWPSVRTLFLLRLWSMIFPPSDFRHVVMTPAMLLMAEYLVQCSVTSGRNIIIGLFLCTLLLAVVRQARRFCPEALCFLYAVMLSALPRGKFPFETAGCPAYMVELVASRSWLLVQGDCTAAAKTFQLDFDFVMSSDEASAYFKTNIFRVTALHCAIQTLQGFVHIYKDLASFPEIFYPFLIILEKLLLFVPDCIKDSLLWMTENIKKMIVEHERVRQPLRMRTKKPVPIKQFNPKFEENFALGRDYDPDRERAERKKLQRQIKKEARGAARELRKDNYFLQEEKAKEKAALGKEREEKYRKAMAFLQEQEHAFKSGQLGKRRR